MNKSFHLDNISRVKCSEGIITTVLGASLSGNTFRIVMKRCWILLDAIFSSAEPEQVKLTRFVKSFFHSFIAVSIYKALQKDNAIAAQRNRIKLFFMDPNPVLRTLNAMRDKFKSYYKFVGVAHIRQEIVNVWLKVFREKSFIFILNFPAMKKIILC